MELSMYDIIKGIVVSPKSLLMRHKLGKITFRVSSSVNKIMVRDAIEKIWNVKVRDVRMVNTKGKTKNVRRITHKRPDIKKAIVTLKPGFKIDLPDQYETMGLGKQSAAQTGEGQ